MFGGANCSFFSLFPCLFLVFCGFCLYFVHFLFLFSLAVSIPPPPPPGHRGTPPRLPPLTPQTHSPPGPWCDPPPPLPPPAWGGHTPNSGSPPAAPGERLVWGVPSCVPPLGRGRYRDLLPPPGLAFFGGEMVPVWGDVYTVLIQFLGVYMESVCLWERFVERWGVCMCLVRFRAALGCLNALGRALYGPGGRSLQPHVAFVCFRGSEGGSVCCWQNPGGSIGPLGGSGGGCAAPVERYSLYKRTDRDREWV